MGGAVKAVGKAIGSVGKAVGSVISGVAKTVGSITKSLGPVGTLAAVAGGAYMMNPGMFGAATTTAGAGAGYGSAAAFESAMGLNTAYNAVNTYAGLGAALGSAAGTVGDMGLVYNSATGTWLNPSYYVGTSTPLAAYTGTGNFLSNVATGTTNLVKNIGSSLGSLNEATGGVGSISNLSRLVQIGSGIYGLGNTGQTPEQAQNATDPYAPYRAEAARKLNMLMENPNMVYGMPGYNFAQKEAAKQIQRQAAATGTGVSGATLASLQTQGAKTAQDWFNNYVTMLAQQSGANVSPAAGGEAYANTQAYNDKMKTAAIQNIMQGAAGLNLGGFFG